MIATPFACPAVAGAPIAGVAGSGGAGTTSGEAATTGLFAQALGSLSPVGTTAGTTVGAVAAPGIVPTPSSLRSPLSPALFQMQAEITAPAATFAAAPPPATLVAGAETMPVTTADPAAPTIDADPPVIASPTPSPAGPAASIPAPPIPAPLLSSDPEPTDAPPVATAPIASPVDDTASRMPADSRPILRRDTTIRSTDASSPDDRDETVAAIDMPTPLPTLAMPIAPPPLPVAAPTPSAIAALPGATPSTAAVATIVAGATAPIADASEDVDGATDQQAGVDDAAADDTVANGAEPATPATARVASPFAAIAVPANAPTPGPAPAPASGAAEPDTATSATIPTPATSKPIARGGRAAATADRAPAATSPGAATPFQHAMDAVAPRAHDGAAAPAASSVPPTTTQPNAIAAAPGRIGQQMGVAIARHVAAGAGETMTVRLDPIEFGRIEVKLSFDDAGTLRAVVAADSPAALDMLRRDSGDLGRALADAGLRADGQSLKFDQRSGTGADAGGQSGQPPQRQPASAFRADGLPADDAASPEEYRPLPTRGGIDLMA